MESNEETGRVGFCESRSPPLPLLFPEMALLAGFMKVGAVASWTAVPHEGQATRSSGISCEHEGHFIVLVSAFYKKKKKGKRKRREL
jgi:hypothetical protein